MKKQYPSLNLPLPAEERRNSGDGQSGTRNSGDNRSSYPHYPKTADSRRVDLRRRLENTEDDSFTSTCYYLIGTVWIFIFSILFWYGIRAPTIIYTPVNTTKAVMEQAQEAQFEDDGVMRRRTAVRTCDRDCDRYTIETDAGMHGFANALFQALHCSSSPNTLANKTKFLYANFERIKTSCFFEERDYPEDIEYMRHSLSEFNPACAEDCGASDIWLTNFQEEIFEVAASDNMYENVTNYYEVSSYGTIINDLIISFSECLINSNSDAEWFNLCMIQAQSKIFSIEDFKNNHDIRDRTVCVMGTLWHVVRFQTVGVNPVNVATLCSDEKNKPGPGYGVGFLRVAYDTSRRTKSVLALTASGGFRVFEGIVRLLAEQRMREDIGLTAYRKSMKLKPYVYYDPFVERVILDDVYNTIDPDVKSIEFWKPRATLLSSLPPDELAHHQRWVISVSNSLTTERVKTDGCYKDCDGYSPTMDNFD